MEVPSRAPVVSCQFRYHHNLQTCELMGSPTTTPRAMRKEEKYVVRRLTNGSRSVRFLAMGSALSVMVDGIEYDANMRSHYVRGVPKVEVHRLWQRCVVSFGSIVLLPWVRISFRGLPNTPLVGMYVCRDERDCFSVGLILHHHPRTMRSLNVLGAFRLATGLAFSASEEVPIAATLRQVEMEVTLSPRENRITPRTHLPAIRVILVGRHAPAAPSTWRGPPPPAAMLPFEAFECVRLFLCSPSQSQLVGATQVPVPQRICSALVDLEWIDGNDALDQTNTYSSLARNPVFEVLRFTNLSVEDVGEHHIGAQLCVSEAYQPFVSSICRHIYPFLVVSQR